MIEKPTIHHSTLVAEGLSRPQISLCFDHQNDCSFNELVEYCLTLPEVKNLNPDSDYNEQYFTIEVAAESLYITFRKEEYS